MKIEEPGIAVHTFFAVMQEYALGRITGAQATAILGLSAGEATDANNMLTVILAQSSADGGLSRRAKAAEFENVLILAENRVAGYNTVAAIKARLGVA
jgi:hypothetical protein